MAKGLNSSSNLSASCVHILQTHPKDKFDEWFNVEGAGGSVDVNDGWAAPHRLNHLGRQQSCIFFFSVAPQRVQNHLYILFIPFSLSNILLVLKGRKVEKVNHIL